MPGCAVSKCNNYSRKTKGTNIKYFSFPKEETVRKISIIVCKREDYINLKDACVCSVHFDASSYQISLKHELLKYQPKNSRSLKKDAIPTENLPSSATRLKRKFDAGRATRANKRSPQSIINDIFRERDLVTTHTTTAESAQHSQKTGIDEEDMNEIGQLKTRILALETENNNIKIKYDQLLVENQTLELQLNNAVKQVPQDIKNILCKIFTAGQIKLLLNPNIKKIHWCAEDIAAAISLRSVSSKAYRYLRKNNFPLPALSTLRIWASYLNVDQGNLDYVLQLMHKKRKNLSVLERLTVLTFDEIYILILVKLSAPVY